MRSTTEWAVPEEKRLLYWLGERLIRYRMPVSAAVLLLTSFFAYHAWQLQLVTSFGELLPQSHPYIKIHNRFAHTFGGANNIMVMLEVKDGTIFNPETLNKIWRMTEGMDTVYGVNHNQIESIAHRTVRYLKVAAGGTMRATPVMLGEVKSQEEAAQIRRVVHNAENIYGILVSLDDKAALIRANFIEGRLDYRRIFHEVNERVVEPFVDANTAIYVAGEPRLYGWVYHYAGDVFWILVIAYCIEWLFRWLYFHDWRGALRPTITGVIAAIWGLGFIRFIGFALDPLMLVMPFLITARAVSHSVQMHDRYYEELEKSGWHKRRAIVAAFAELFVPTLSGITTDALGVLVILLVPVIMLQKLAITASFWIFAITVSELLLNPIVYDYLKAPEPALVVSRNQGVFRQTVVAAVDRLLSRRGLAVCVGAWSAAALVAIYFVRGLTIGDPTSASPLLWQDSPYNVSHQRIQDKFGGVEPLIIVAEGLDRDAMKDPATLRRMERFQRELERDPSVGYSFSLADIIRAVNAVFHELEPKWGVIPNNWIDVGGLFFIYFSGSPPSETAKYVDPSYTTAHVTFFCKDHKGDNIRRLIRRCQEFMFTEQLGDLGIDIEERDGRAHVRQLDPKVRWELAGPSWTVSEHGVAGEGPFRAGDRIVRIGRTVVTDVRSLREAFAKETADAALLDFGLERGGEETNVTIVPPWKAVFKLAGGLIGTLAAANEELFRNDVLMNVLGFATMWVIMLFTYRSFAAGLYLLAPLLFANLVVNAYMAGRNIGINIHTLPLVTVGVGFGIDYGLYIVSRTIEELRRLGDVRAAVREALVTSGKAVTFTALSMTLVTALWSMSNIRFNAEMGFLLAMWMVISYLGAVTLLPASLILLRPRFLTRQRPPATQRRKA